MPVLPSGWPVWSPLLRPRTLPDSPPTHVVNQFRAPARLCLAVFSSSDLIAVWSLADPSYLSTALPFARCLFLASRFINLFACLSLPHPIAHSPSSLLVYICPVVLRQPTIVASPSFGPIDTTVDARPYDIFLDHHYYLLVDGFVITSRCPVTPFNIS